MASVTLRDICKSYDGTPITRHIDLEIEDGEFVVFVGPSGCGKSTLLRLIAGLEDITSGDLLIGDQRVNDLPPKDRSVGMVFQSYALYPHMTVAENMAFGLKLASVDKREIARRVEAVAEILQLDKLLERKPKDLSGGQRQRVAIARATILKPTALLADEPTGNLDHRTGAEVVALLEALHHAGTTLIVVTHDRELGARAHRHISIRDGEIVGDEQG